MLIHWQVLTKPSTVEVTKEPCRPLPSSASSTSSRTSVDEGGSEGGGPVSLSTKQLVYIAADIQKLQEKVFKSNTCVYGQWSPPTYCFMFLKGVRVVRGGQTEAGGHRIQKLCCCGWWVTEPPLNSTVMIITTFLLDRNMLRRPSSGSGCSISSSLLC